MSRTDHTAPHLPDRYIRRLLRVYADINILTRPCWIDDVLDHCPDGLAFSIQLTNARDTLTDLLGDLGIEAGDDAPDADQLAPAAAQGELLGLDVDRQHPARESATAAPRASRGGISESAGGVQ